MNLLYAIVLLLLTSVAPADDSAQQLPNGQSSVHSLELTAVERKWLLSHHKIRVAFDASLPPYSFVNKSGKFEGIAVEIMNAASQKLGIVLQLYPKASWQEIYAATLDHRVDVIATMVDRPERRLWFNFTHPYLTKSLVIITQKSDSAINNRNDLFGKKVAFVKDYEFSDRLVKEVPIKPYAVKSMLACLRAVDQKRADACITFVGTAQYLQNKYHLSNLKFAGFFERNTADESIAVRKDWPILAGILQKSLDSLSESEINAIYFKWLPLETTIDHSETSPNDLYSSRITPWVPREGIIGKWKIGLYYFSLCGLIILWLVLFQYYRRNAGNQLAEEKVSGQNLKQLQSDFERMMLKRTAELNHSERKYRNLVENMHKDYFFYQRDRQGTMTYVSPSVTYMLGYQPDNFSRHFRTYLTKNPANRKVDAVLESCIQGIPTPPYQLEFYDAENKRRWLEIADAPVYDDYGNCIGVDGLAFDITQRKLEEENLIWLSFHDELTGLANRRLFYDRIQQTIPLSNRNSSPFAVLSLNIDNFRQVIDEVGHAAGHYVIREIAKKMIGTLRESDTAACFGGGEFAILLPDTDVNASVIVAQKLIKNLNAPIFFGVKTITFNINIGISLYPGHGSNPDMLLRHADDSMAYAKTKQLGYSSVATA